MRLLLWCGGIGLAGWMLLDWLMRGTHQAPFIAIRVTSYRDPLISPNSNAMEDVERFEKRWPTGAGGFWSLSLVVVLVCVSSA